MIKIITTVINEFGIRYEDFELLISRNRNNNHKLTKSRFNKRYGCRNMMKFIYCYKKICQISNGMLPTMKWALFKDKTLEPSWEKFSVKYRAELDYLRGLSDIDEDFDKVKFEVIDVILEYCTGEETAIPVNEILEDKLLSSRYIPEDDLNEQLSGYISCMESDSSLDEISKSRIARVKGVYEEIIYPNKYLMYQAPERVKGLSLPFHDSPVDECLEKKFCKKAQAKGPKTFLRRIVKTMEERTMIGNKFNMDKLQKLKEVKAEMNEKFSDLLDEFVNPAKSESLIIKGEKARKAITVSSFGNDSLQKDDIVSVAGFYQDSTLIPVKKLNKFIRLKVFDFMNNYFKVNNSNLKLSLVDFKFSKIKRGFTIGRRTGFEEDEKKQALSSLKQKFEKLYPIWLSEFVEKHSKKEASDLGNLLKRFYSALVKKLGAKSLNKKKKLEIASMPESQLLLIGLMTVSKSPMTIEAMKEFKIRSSIRKLIIRSVF